MKSLQREVRTVTTSFFRGSLRTGRMGYWKQQLYVCGYRFESNGYRFERLVTKYSSFHPDFVVDPFLKSALYVDVTAIMKTSCNEQHDFFFFLI